MSESPTFSINSVEEAEQFERLLQQYSRQIHHGFIVSDGSGRGDLLSTLYTLCQDHCYFDNRLFYAYVDLKFTYLFMYRDTGQAGGTWNSFFTPEKLQTDSILQDIQTFSAKMDILCSLTSFAMRCRAFWDKYLGLFVLLYDTENYDEFCASKSKKRKFRQIASKWDSISPRFEECLGKNIGDLILITGRLKKSNPKREELFSSIPFPEPYIECLLKFIEALDEFRTPEVHGTGRLRKWSLSILPLELSKDFSLLNHWNVANSFMQALEDVLGCLTTFQHGVAEHRKLTNSDDTSAIFCPIEH